LTCYLLDTNILSDMAHNPQGRIAEQIARVGELGVSGVDRRHVAGAR
jgi:predicted nucleic acid-binding protein